MADIFRRTTHVNAIRAILAFVRGNEFDGASLERANIQLRNLNRFYQEFTAVHMGLIGGNINQAEYDEHERLKATIENEVVECEEALTRKINGLQQANQPAPVVAQQQQPQVIQIEGLNRLLAQKVENVWGEFDGTQWKWAQFKDLFRAAVHDNEHLSGAQKFQFLQKSLKGDAKEAVGYWQVTDDNYQHAYERLCNLYDRPHQAATELLNRIYDLEDLKGPSSKGLQHLSNVANDVKRQMTALNYRTEHWDVMFITILQRKLDNESKKDWEIQRGPEEPTLDAMLRFIENRARALSNLKVEFDYSKVHKGNHENRKRFGDKQSYHGPPKKPFTPTNSEQINRSSSNRIVCAFCEGSHFTRMCNKYTVKDCAGREKMVKDKKLCINCLAPGHFAKNCVQGGCKRCENKKHNSTLCPANPFLSQSHNIMSNKVKKEKKNSKGAKQKRF